MFKTNTRQTVELKDWNSLVETTYGRPYNFQQQGYKSRGIYVLRVPIDSYKPEDFERTNILSCQESGVSFEAWLSRDPKEPFPFQKYDFETRIFWERNFYPSIEMVAMDLYARRQIEPGVYTIIIDW
jgi:hypothetical protein